MLIHNFPALTHYTRLYRFSRDLKPAHGSPDFARDIAMQKITARVQGARMASEELGI